MGDNGDEQDRMVPIANVGRIMKRILPPSAKISKEARQTVQECATEFISFVTGEASDRCRKENRKTVNGDDICWALSSLGFDNYAQAMLRYLCRYREAHDREKPSQVISSPDHDLSNIPMDNNNNNTTISAEIVSTSSNNNNSNISPSDNNFMEFKIM